MNSGPTPPRPDDEASDPLLAALRQRLGDYGQAPPPGAWATIRQQLPQPAALRPWWRRPQQLLPLLALLLGLLSIGTFAILRKQLAAGNQVAEVKKASRRRSTQRTATTPSLAGLTNRKLAGAKPVRSTATSSSLRLSPDAISATTVGLAATNTSAKQLAHGASSDPLLATSQEFIGRKARAGAVVRPLTMKPASRSTHRGKELKAPVLAQTTQHREKSPLLLAGELLTSRTKRGAHLVRRQLKNTRVAPTSYPATSGVPATATSRTSSYKAQPTSRSTAHGSFKHHHTAPLGAALPPTSRRAIADAATRNVSGFPKQLEGSVTLAFDTDTPEDLSTQFDSLALRAAALELPVASVLPALAALPDSVPPALPRARRWALLALAGPTLSYRTLGPAPTLAAQHPDFARLERPALGWGAQLQVRRVLSGRWGLALGLGYQEYATRLALTLIDSSKYSAKSVHQRDTYRVLTLPVQLSYALGAPQHRQAWALLVGAEPSWYQGGRSTEGSDCGCEQQVYSSAADGPYRAWSLALSLGLDLHYQIGGVGSRWHWLVQPTARYILTPFIQKGAVGYTQRQPFSMGLLTGFSWDIR